MASKAAGGGARAGASSGPMPASAVGSGTGDGGGAGTMTAEERSRLLQGMVISRLSVLLNDRPTLVQVLEDGYDVSHMAQGFPPLPLSAVLSGSVATLRALLARSPPPRLGLVVALQRRRMTLLHVATLLGFPDVVRELVSVPGMSAVLSLDAVTLGGPQRDMEPFVFAAAAAGQLATLRFFIEKCGLDATLRLPPFTASSGESGPDAGMPRSRPLDCLHAACVGIRPYVPDLCDLLESVLSPQLEQLGAGGMINIPAQAFAQPWPRGAHASMATDSGDVVAAAADVRGVLSALVDIYGLGMGGGEGMRASFPPSRWHDYAYTAAMHANAPAVAFFLERGLLQTPLPHSPAGAAPPPPLALFRDKSSDSNGDVSEGSGGKEKELVAASATLLWAAAVRPLDYHLTALEGLHSALVRLTCRPPFTFKVALLCRATALACQTVLSLPHDIAATAACVARAAARAAPRGAELSPLYGMVASSACLRLAHILTPLDAARREKAPHYVPQNRDGVLAPNIVAAAEAQANHFAQLAQSLLAIQRRDEGVRAALAASAAATAASAGAADADFRGLLDPSVEMTQERFTDICRALDVSESGATARRDAVWASGGAAAPPSNAEAAASGDPLIAALAQRDAPPPPGGLRGLADRLTRVVQAAPEKLSDVMRASALREARSAVATLLWYRAHPHVLSISSSLWTLAEDVCTPGFWGADASNRLAAAIAEGFAKADDEVDVSAGDRGEDAAWGVTAPADDASARVFAAMRALDEKAADADDSAILPSRGSAACGTGAFSAIMAAVAAWAAWAVLSNGGRVEVGDLAKAWVARLT